MLGWLTYCCKTFRVRCSKLRPFFFFELTILRIVISLSKNFVVETSFFCCVWSCFFFGQKGFQKFGEAKIPKSTFIIFKANSSFVRLFLAFLTLAYEPLKFFHKKNFTWKEKKKQIHTNLPISCPISKSLRISFLNGDCIYTKCFGVFDFGHDLWFWEIIFLGSYKKSRISDCNIGKNKPNQLMDIWYHVRLIFSAFALSIFLGLTVPVLLFFMFKLVNRMRESLVLTEIYYSKFAPLKQKAADFLRHNHITIGSKVSKNQ